MSFGIVPGGESIMVVSGSSVNERQSSNALVFGGQAECACVCVCILQHSDIWLSELSDAVIEDAVKYS